MFHRWTGILIQGNGSLVSNEPPNTFSMNMSYECALYHFKQSFFLSSIPRSHYHIFTQWTPFTTPLLNTNVHNQQQTVGPWTIIARIHSSCTPTCVGDSRSGTGSGHPACAESCCPHKSLHPGPDTTQDTFLLVYTQLRQPNSHRIQIPITIRIFILRWCSGAVTTCNPRAPLLHPTNPSHLDLLPRLQYGVVFIGMAGSKSQNGAGVG